MARVKKGDTVRVIAGRERGKFSIVTRVFNGKVWLEGLNLVHCYYRANPQKDDPGGIKKEEAPLDISNVALIDVDTEKIVKVGFKQLADGKKVRYNKENGETIDQ